MAQRGADHAWRPGIRLTGSPLKNLNSYLVTGSGRSLLIAGLASQLLRGDGQILISGRDAGGLAACRTEER